MFKYVVILMIIALVLGILFSSPLFVINEISLSGYEVEDIPVTELKGQNIFMVELTEIQEVIEQDPYVEEVEVRRRFPDKLELLVVDNQPLAALRNNDKYVVFNAYQQIIGENLAENRYQVPVLENVAYNFRGQEVVLDEEVNMFLQELAKLPEDKLQEIKKVDFSGYQLSFSLEEGAEIILGGYDELERKFNIFYSALEQNIFAPENIEYLDISAPDRPVIREKDNSDNYNDE